MSALAGTAELVRFNLCRDRIVIPVCVVAFVAIALLTTSSLGELYLTRADRAALAATIGVDAQRQDERSFLALYHRLLRLRRALGWGSGLITSPESTADQLIYYDEVDGRRYCIVARIGDGTHTTQLPIPGHLLLRADQPVPQSGARLDAIALTGPDAVVIELARS